MPFRLLCLASLLAASGAHSRGPIRLRWENRGQAAGADGAAVRVAVQGDAVVVTGKVWRTVGGTRSIDWYVRALDAKTGAILWEDRFAAIPAFDRPQHVAIDGGRVFASGWITSETGGLDLAIRAYALSTGERLWQRRLIRSGIDLAEVVAAHGGRVFAITRIRGASGVRDAAVLAFDAPSGVLLWESATNTEGRPQSDYAFAVLARRLFVASGMDDRSALRVRAHDVATGRIEWDVEPPNVRSAFSAQSVAAGRGLVFLSGMRSGSPDPGQLWWAALDARTGAIRWEQSTDDPERDAEAGAVALEGDRLYAATVDHCAEACAMVLRALDAATGTERWRHAVAGERSAVSGLAVQGGRVFAGGHYADPSFARGWLLRAHDASTGAILWDVRTPPVPADGSTIWSLAVSGSTVYAAGGLETPSGSDLTIQAYTGF